MTHPIRYAAERLALRALMLVALILFIQLAVPVLWDTLSPFIIALPIAAALQPLIRFFEKRLRLPRGFAVTFWAYLQTGSVVVTSVMAGIFLVTVAVSVFPASVVTVYVKVSVAVSPSARD